MQMLTIILAAQVAATQVPAPEPAPEPTEQPAPKAEVIERDAEGRATRVRVEGRDYAVCAEGQQDGCINPREAGLDFGSVPLDHWPGRPASESEPIPPQG